MTHSHTGLVQSPPTESLRLHHRGDVVEFFLTVPQAAAGSAWLRTNLLNGHTLRQELIRHVEAGEPVRATAWHDVPMSPTGDGRFRVAVPLTEVGRFEAKAFFLANGSRTPLWPAGGNTVLKVEPAEYVCGASIYTAFVRQFGLHQKSAFASPPSGVSLSPLDAAGYAAIPPSGTFRQLAAEIGHIVGTLGFRIVQLLPIHPVPTTFARMGRFGSPYAALDFMDVDPALAEFDTKATPLDQFRELVAAVHEHRARLFLDIPVNHTGWASQLQIHHPEWFVRNTDGSFHTPEVWGVRWEDLSQLDYGRRELWVAMADVFLFWCRQGVDGFRCDAGYMVPLPAWEYIVAKVRDTYPDTIFLLEGLGGRIETMENLLTHANLDWAYSELFQNYDQGQIQAYLPSCIHTSETRGGLVHFAETHDNNRLAGRSHDYARLRTAWSALASHNGLFGITSGVEWFAPEKLDVHGAAGLNWGAAANQVDGIRRLNSILASHPAFHAGARLRLIQQNHDNALALLRVAPDSERRILVLANLNEDRRAVVRWHTAEAALTPGRLVDLLTGRSVAVEVADASAHLTLDPAAVLCLSPDPLDVEAVHDPAPGPGRLPPRSTSQCLAAMALEVQVFFGRDAEDGSDAPAVGRRLAEDPEAFLAEAAGPRALSAIAAVEWPRDAGRTTLVTPGSILIVRAPSPFDADMVGVDGTVQQHRESIEDARGRPFALFTLTPSRLVPGSYRLHIQPRQSGARGGEAPLLMVEAAPGTRVAPSLSGAEAVTRDACVLLTNGTGAMAQVRGAWGEIRSQYDAWLSANLDASCPVDRHTMLVRCRGWLVYRGHSQEISAAFLDAFSVTASGDASWVFEIPVGEQKAVLEIRLAMVPGHNAVNACFQLRSFGGPGALAQDPVGLILRPDVDDRVNHEVTKAYTGPESAWLRALKPTPSGFVFAPAHTRQLEMSIQPGTFVLEPEWKYMVSIPFDGERGLNSNLDLFSPGYFSLSLRAGEQAVLAARVNGAKGSAPETGVAANEDAAPWPEVLKRAMQAFVVRRDGGETVIAGYPWFLDWGRDTFISLRGLIAAGYQEQARRILSQFARFEDRGTIPNMIRGQDSTNRDTSDAPLWFFVACADLVKADGNAAFLATDAGGRSILDVLRSVAHGYLQGTPNGIRVDPSSGLVFSPAHFTWMDTNHPAATPREGYPIEIQALWFSALDFLARHDAADPWTELRDRVRASILRSFPLPEAGYLSDCLHAAAGQGAAQAVADNALRPNQLLAVTLGAVCHAPTCRAVLSACRELLVPGAIRSLANRPVRPALRVLHHGRLLNDPEHPYRGNYSGDEDTRRKPAYHNGTAWTWLFPSYPEALFLVEGEPARTTARRLLSSGLDLARRSCLGQIPEILDGDAPHTVRGCGAQAWGVTELYRVLAIMDAIA